MYEDADKFLCEPTYLHKTLARSCLSTAAGGDGAAAPSGASTSRETWLVTEFPEYSPPYPPGSAHTNENWENFRVKTEKGE